MSALRLNRLEVLVLGCVAVVAALHLPYPFAGDQALFTVGALELERGAVLYHDFWDLKQPGIYGFYWLAGAAFGFDEAGIHLFEGLWQLLFAWTLIVTLRLHVPQRWMASVAPLVTVVVYYGACGDWHLTQVEGLVGFPLYLSAWLALGTRGGRPPAARLALAGVAGGVVLLFKLFYAPLLCVIWSVGLMGCVRQWRARPVPETLRHGVALAVGLAVPVGTAVAMFAIQGTLRDLWWTYFEYPAEVIGMDGARYVGRLFQGLGWFSLRFGPLLALATLGQWRRWRDGTFGTLRRGLVAWAAVGLVLVLLQQWWEYHFLLVYVPVGLLALDGVDLLSRRLRSDMPAVARGRRALVVALVALLFSSHLVGLAGKTAFLVKHRLCLTPETQAAYQSKFSPTVAAIRGELPGFEGPDARDGTLFVLGNPLLQYLSGRRVGIPTNGWSPEGWTKAQWQRVHANLRRIRPAYIYVQWINEQLIDRAYPQLRELFGDPYVLARQTREGTLWRLVEDD